MEDLDDVDETFNAAAEFVRANSQSFQQETLLKLYARFKQAKNGPCNTKRPGMFDFEGKQKWDAWHGLGELARDQAMREYVRLLAQVQPDWEAQLEPSEKSKSKQTTKKPLCLALKPSKKSKRKQTTTTLGVAVSTMVNTDGDLDDELKTVFDWCKDGNSRRVAKLIDSNKMAVNNKDTEGMTLLHWACDRGDGEMVQTLLDKRAAVDLQDAEGQTPLHFAVICEHPDIVRLLLSYKASTSIADGEGQTVLDLDTSPDIKHILDTHTSHTSVR